MLNAWICTTLNKKMVKLVGEICNLINQYYMVFNLLKKSESLSDDLLDTYLKNTRVVIKDFCSCLDIMAFYKYIREIRVLKKITA